MALDFPLSPGLSQIYGVWQWDGGKWVSLPESSGTGGGIPEAPTDNVGYGRYNATWTPVLRITGDVLDGGSF